MKLLVVAALVAALVVGRRYFLRRQAALQRDRGPHPRVPSSLLAGAPRTWVVFTTPYCASCEPVRRKLAEADPTARVVTVDATREPALAGAFRVRSAPTVLLADGAGEISTRLVGAGAVSDYLATA